MIYDMNYIIRTNINLKKDLKTYTKFDPTSKLFWLDDYTNKLCYNNKVYISTLREFVNNHPKIKTFH